MIILGAIDQEILIKAHLSQVLDDFVGISLSAERLVGFQLEDAECLGLEAEAQVVFGLLIVVQKDVASCDCGAFNVHHVFVVLVWLESAQRSISSVSYNCVVS